MAFGLAKEFKILDPFQMLEEMPDSLWHHWMAYERLRDSGYRQQAHWDLLKETDEAKFIEEQEQSVLSIIRGAKLQSAARQPASNKSKQPGTGGLID